MSHDTMTTVSRDPIRPHVSFAIQGLHGTSGGAERVLVDVANGWHRRGFQVSVLTFQAQNGPSFYPLDYGITRLDGRRRHGRGGGRHPADGLANVADRHRATKRHAVGTSALRDAANGAAFVAAAGEALGCELEVISGMREAELALAGGVVGVYLAGGVLSVASTIGFMRAITVSGFSVSYSNAV